MVGLLACDNFLLLRLEDSADTALGRVAVRNDVAGIAALTGLGVPSVVFAIQAA